MTEPIQNRTRNRFYHRTSNQCGTRSGTTDQNQSQIQTVVKGSCGLSMAKKSIHRFGSRGLELDKRMAAGAAKIRGLR